MVCFEHDMKRNPGRIDNKKILKKLNIFEGLNLSEEIMTKVT